MEASLEKSGHCRGNWTKSNGKKIMFISKSKLRSNIQVPTQYNIDDEIYDATWRKDVNKPEKCSLARIC